MLKVKFTVCVVLFYTCTVAIIVHENEGEPCRVEANNNGPGECKILMNCQEALDDIAKGKYPQICSIQGTVRVVCCPIKPEPPRAGEPGYLSLQKCKEYSKAVFNSSFSINSQSVKETTCTHIVKPLVIGGGKANPKEFPHMARLGCGLQKTIEWICGGTLISEQFVLTAAYCTSFHREPVRWIRLGELNIVKTTDDAQPEDFGVSQTFKHPQRQPTSKYNDIALVKMDRPVSQFTQYVRPACLNTATTLPPTQKYIATGWGDTQTGKYKGSDHLLKVVLESFSQHECNSSYGITRKYKDGIRPDSQLCAGAHTAGIGTCKGDGGGPLQIYSDVHCMYDIVGVISFGKSCGGIGIPEVATRVSHYLTWIEDTVWPTVNPLI